MAAAQDAIEQRPCERLLRYCAQPPFASERLRELDPQRLLYEGTKPGPGGNASLLLTPLELLDRLAALVPPPSLHRHRYFGVLAPNAPLRAAVTALALAAATTPQAPSPEPLGSEPVHRRVARYVWALLLTRIYEVFPFVCPLCGANMRVIAFIIDAPTIHDIIVHSGGTGRWCSQRRTAAPAAPRQHTRARPALFSLTATWARSISF